MRGQLVNGSRRGRGHMRWARRCGRYYIDYFENFESASREKINELLIDEFPTTLSKEEKLAKISNILSYLRINGKIFNTGTKHSPIWVSKAPNEIQDRIQVRKPDRKTEGKECLRP